MRATSRHRSRSVLDTLASGMLALRPAAASAAIAATNAEGGPGGNH
jgi:hypothetical protein